MKPQTVKAAHDHAISEYPKEACGLVVVSGRKETYFPCRNVADVPEYDFVIHRDDLAKAEDMGEVTMVVHSHPEASPYPTPTDLINCEEYGVPWTIYAVHRDYTTPDGPPVVAAEHVFAPTGYVRPYTGREFIFGSDDCYGLIREFYNRDMGIELPDFERTDKFWERGEDLYMDNFAGAGFVEVSEVSEKGDLILMAIRSDIVNHAAIWLNDGPTMLHHPYNHLSEKTVYGGYWAEHHRLTIRKVR